MPYRSPIVRMPQYKDSTLKSHIGYASIHIFTMIFFPIYLYNLAVSPEVIRRYGDTRTIISGSQRMIVRRSGTDVQARCLEIMTFPVKIVLRILFPPAKIRALEITFRGCERFRVWSWNIKIYWLTRTSHLRVT